MFDAGAIAAPTVSWLPALPVLLPLLGIAFPRPRVALALAVLGGLSAVAVTALVWAGPSLLLPLGVAARIGQLELVLALLVDPLGGVLSAGAFLTAAVLAARQRSPRRLRLLAALCAAVQLAVLADGAALLLLAGGLAAALASALGRTTPTALLADRTSDVAFAAAAALWFWSLGGSWVHGTYVPELEPRVTASTHEFSSPLSKSGGTAAEPEDDRPQRDKTTHGTLSFTEMPGAAVMVDGTWLKVRAPFDDFPITAGAHSLRVHPGAGSDDYVLPTVTVPEDGHLSLAVRGATTTFREADGTPLGHRRLFGTLLVADALLLLIALGVLARVLSFATERAPARALVGLTAMAAAARFAPFEATGAARAACAAGLLVASALALARADRLPGELAFAAAATLANPAAGVLHAIAATALHGDASRARRWALLPTRVLAILSFYGMSTGAVPTVLALVVLALALLPMAPARSTSPGFPTAALHAGARALLEIERAGAVATAFLDDVVRAAAALLSIVERGLRRMTAGGQPRPFPALARVVLVPAAVGAAALFLWPWLG